MRKSRPASCSGALCKRRSQIRLPMSKSYLRTPQIPTERLAMKITKGTYEYRLPEPIGQLLSVTCWTAPRESDPKARAIPVQIIFWDQMETRYEDDINSQVTGFPGYFSRNGDIARIWPIPDRDTEM